MDQHAFFFFYKADILKAQVRQIFPSTVGLQMNMNVPKYPLWKRSVTFLVATSLHFTQWRMDNVTVRHIM